MAESAAINKSLSVLGQVVHALNQGAVCSRLVIGLQCYLRALFPTDPHPLSQFQVDTHLARRPRRNCCWPFDLQSRPRLKVQTRYPEHPQVSTNHSLLGATEEADGTTSLRRLLQLRRTYQERGKQAGNQ